MQLKILGSASSGNCYVLGNSTTSLLIECGISAKEIKRGIDFNISKVAGVLISHEHQDHCKAAKDLIAAGINIYCSAGTAKALDLPPRRVKVLEALKRYRIGEFTVMPFDVKHDSAEPFGFLIEHPDCGNVLFITDSFYVTQRFKNLTNIIVEANYCPDIVREKFRSEELHRVVRDRVIQSHMSIDTAVNLLLANDLSRVNNIVLAHLSDSNSDEQAFKTRVELATGKKVTIADKGVTINFNKQPF